MILTRSIVIITLFLMIMLMQTAAQTAVSETITRMLHAVDARHWDAVRAAFADDVTTDYTSLFGGEVQTQPADDLIGGWSAFLPGFDATHHLTGPFAVDVRGDTARARCAVTARHRIDEVQWIVGGHYDVELARREDGWAITALTLEMAFVEGNTSLPEQAQRRTSGR